jgi:hypothetical protein
MSDDNVDYYSKYLKYKKKYLDLQVEIDGGKKFLKKKSKTPPAVKGTPASAKSDKVAAGKALYTAGYKAYAGTIKGAAGVCLASESTMDKFHATEISKTTAKNELQAYKGTAKTFGDLKKETGYACAMTDKAKSAAKYGGKAASGAAKATGAVLGATGTVAKGALHVAASGAQTMAAASGDVAGAVLR